MSTLEERREAFRAEMRELIRTHKMKTARKLTPDMTCICVLVSEWVEGCDDVWEDEGNKSAPRDVQCAGCQGQLVMSNWMHAQYQAMPVKPPVLCMPCASKAMEKKG